MRIIKPGREPKKEIEQTCERCGCEFAYGKEDIKSIEVAYNYTAYFVVCPTCGERKEVEPWSGY